MKKILLLVFILSNIHMKAQCWKTSAATGYYHNIIVKADGTLWAWGNNQNGQLGNGTTTQMNVPTKSGTANDWKAVAAGWGHSVALKNDGALWAWGYGILGQIGNGTSTVKEYNPPQQIGTAKDWQTIAAGAHQTFAIKTDGTLWAWGNNEFGQLGDGSTINKNTPTQIGTSNNWKILESKDFHTVALKKDGTLWAWGKNNLGQLGDGTTTQRIVPIQIGTETNWKEIAVGSEHTVALKTDGTLWAWGFNGGGGLGDGTNVDKATPTQIGNETNWETIEAGGSDSFALKKDGSLWAWGYNDSGKLGDGTTTNSLIPKQIGTTTDWQVILSGYSHTVALKSNGVLWTWGNNTAGQLGDNTTLNKKVPTAIVCPGTFTVTTAQTNINCTNDTSGSASITSVVGGTAPYSYLWSNGATTTSITGLIAGNYSCTITDANSLSNIKSFIITQPTPLVSTTSITSPDCNNDHKGSITVITTGGTAPYTFGLDGGATYQTSNMFNNLAAGIYQPSVRDSKGCIVSNFISITPTNTPSPTATAQTLNNTSTVANLQATGSNLKWYTAMTGGIVLDLSVVLQTGKYYVSQTIDGCESTRTAVDVIITSELPPYVPSNGLIAYYPFNGNANDTSGNKYNGIVNGASLTTNRLGNPNSAYSFDGASSYIDATIATIPQNNAPRTISGWFQSNTPNPNETMESCIFNYGSLSPTQRFSLGVYSKGYLQFITGTNSNNLSSNNDYLNNTWYFFTITYDGTKTSLFVNGNYVEGGNTTLNTINKTFRIGKRITGDTYSEYFKGSIDDIGIWNRVLTQQEILNLYNSGQTVSITTIISANSPTTFCLGNSVQLTSAVSPPSGPYTYTWIRNGIIIPNQTSANYTASLSGSYSLIVTNANDSSITSNSNTVNIIVNETPPPTANTQTFNTGATVANLQANGLDIKWYNTNIGGTPLSTSTVLQTGKYYASQTVNGCESPRTAIDVTTQASVAYTLIPDVNFENKLITLGIDSGTVDGKVLTSSISSLTSLDVSSSSITDLTGIQGFLNLKELRCHSNQLISLNISKNTALTYLSCSFNKLTTLDVSMNTGLTTLGCGNNQLTTLDISKNTALTNLGCLNNQLTALDVSKNTALTILDCSNNLLTALDVSKNIFLRYFSFNTNQLTTIDLSKNTVLFDLSCYSNRLTVIDVSINKDLTYLYCNSNNLTTLDLTKNTALTTLDCSSNQLKSLALKNGNNIYFSSYTNFKNNPSLTCIQVDNATYSNTNWAILKDATANYSTDCNAAYTLIPNSNFEQKLIDLGIDIDGLNGKISTTSIASITSLDLSNTNITDLTGIENFTALKSFTANGNNLTSVDFSKNLMLEYISISGNNITNLDVSKNTNLSELDFSNNKVTQIDLSQNKELTVLNALGNQLTTLDISQNPKLKSLNIEFNQLKTLNLQNGNNVNFVLAKPTTKLSQTVVYTSFLNNPYLSCIKVDNVAYSNQNWSKIKDATAIYSATCSTLGIEDSVFDKVAIYPNPVKDELHIDNIVLEKATIYDSLGKLIKTTTFKSGTNDNTIHLNGFAKGIYYIYLEGEEANTAKKIIVK